MAANIQQSVLELLERYPAIRGSANALILSYWIVVDGYPTTHRTFSRTTPAESILREAREVWRRHPEYAPVANRLNEDAVQQVFAAFPDAVRV